MKNWKDFIAPTVIVLIVLIAWEISAKAIGMAFILPSPTQIIVRLWELRGSLLLVHMPATLTVILTGLSLSIFLGVGLAVLMNVSKTLEKALYPIIISSQTIPVIALAPIFVLWFGYSIWSKVAVTLLITFFPITVNTYDGLKSSNKDLKDLLLTMGARKRDIFFKLDIPSALPHFYSGLKVAVTLSVIGAAIGEWLGAQAGLGYFSRRMMTQFDGAGVFAPILLLSLIGITLVLLVVLLEKVTLKWRKK
ncbi:ABC transporter permease [Evansella cellulosilytica]|uniref:Binding-protein-dependent transport systems inner membrane component n=1 Tax=Evansella cellulosilytica (strain ATCC 21833 / DSM 2522 / FERM P-1141 / JCM 9156 / N-4) TaxID=649639 RepID=E6TZ11_EVAC2|nr:ABC transporter permease [Evansella cellulosilytica]ADU32454.1 binding-protein-dependent transport systems inner membrane component [Evansella cellulosilytica DSM 2522]